MDRSIFISTSTQGLHPFRDMVSDVLGSQGFHVVVQETFATPNKPIHETLRDGLSRCSGIIALVGPFYGAESPIIKNGATLSYTQYELEFALANGLQTLVFFTSSQFQPALEKNGTLPVQSDEKAELQQAFIRRIKARRSGLGWASFSDKYELALTLAKTDWRPWRR